MIRVEKTPQKIETKLDDLLKKYSFKVRVKEVELLRKQSLGMQDDPWNLKPTITGLIKEESRRNERDAIKDGRTAEDKGQWGEKKKKIVVGKLKRLMEKQNKCKGIQV